MSSRTMFFFFNDTATTEIYTLSLHDALPISVGRRGAGPRRGPQGARGSPRAAWRAGRWRVVDRSGRPEARAMTVIGRRSEEHTSELQSRQYLVCRLLLEKKKNQYTDSLSERI